MEGKILEILNTDGWLDAYQVWNKLKDSIPDLTMPKVSEELERMAREEKILTKNSQRRKAGCHYALPT